MPERVRRLPVFLTIEEVAAILRLRPASVGGLVGSGRLRSYAVTAVERRVALADLEQFLADCETGSPPRA